VGAVVEGVTNRKEVGEDGRKLWVGLVGNHVLLGDVAGKVMCVVGERGKESDLVGAEVLTSTLIADNVRGMVVLTLERVAMRSLRVPGMGIEKHLSEDQLACVAVDEVIACMDLVALVFW
jgi:hypothetical protein